METKRFAWIPIRVSSGKLVWLEYYYFYQTSFDPSTGRPPLSSTHFVFSETTKEKTWRLLKEDVIHNRNIWNTYEYTQKDKL